MAHRSLATLSPPVAGLEKFARRLKVEIADLFTFEPKP
jgi:hypothetical protein